MLAFPPTDPSIGGDTGSGNGESVEVGKGVPGNGESTDIAKGVSGNGESGGVAMEVSGNGESVDIGKGVSGKGESGGDDMEVSGKGESVDNGTGEAEITTWDAGSPGEITSSPWDDSADAGGTPVMSNNAFKGESGLS